MSQNAAGSFAFFGSFQRLERGVPHEFHPLNLMRFQLSGQFFVDAQQRLVALFVKVQHYFVDNGVRFQFKYFIVLSQ